MSLTLRPATREDIPRLLALIRELAIYERAEHEVLATETDLQASLFGDDHTAHALCCEVGGETIGYAVYFYSYSTWLGKRGLYLEDLYITPSQRGHGYGKQVLRHLAQLAVEQGCPRFEWSVLDWNQPAIDFYQSLGAAPQSEWVRYRMSGDALQQFARSSN